MKSATATPSPHKPQGQLARNTAALYTRTVLMLVISLYTSRVILRVLGVDDFAIYSIIGNFVGTFAIVTSTLTMATQRFITVEVGRGSDVDVRKTFSTALSLHLIIALLIILICEVGGLWYISERLVLPPARLSAATVVFHCSLIALLFQFISIPYTSLMIAYEHMGAWAWISIIEVLLKLAAVIVLPLLPASSDYLIWYAVLIVASAAVVRIIYGIYCSIKFPHCRYQWTLSRDLTRQMAGFMGWNILGVGADIVSKQFITLLINAFFALAVNAARGIAIQVENSVTNFTRQISMAFNPQITKSYASGDYDRLVRLVRQGAKLSFFFNLLVSLPLIAEAPTVLDLWLDHYPDFTITFVRLTLVNNLILSLSYTLDTMIFASGRIRSMQLWSGLLLVACYPLSWLCYHWGCAPYFCYFVSIATTFTLVLVKIRIATGLQVQQPLGFVPMLLRYCLPIAATAAVLPWLLQAFGVFESAHIGIFFLRCALYIFWSLAVITILGFDHDERQMALRLIKRHC